MKNLSHKQRLGVAAAVCGVMAIAVAVARTRLSAPTVEYPPCPFTKLPADTVCLIAVKQEPEPEDKEAYAAYRAENKALWEKIRNEGSESNLNADERAAIEAWHKSKYVVAREKAEKVLLENPRSPAGLFARAGALANGESNPALALHQIRTLRRLMELRGQENPDDSVAREWYLRGLLLEIRCLERLGRDEDVLVCVERLEELYVPLPRMKTWPLMRLKRFAEAEITVAATEQSGHWGTTAMNDRKALQSMQFQREASYATGKRILAVDAKSAVYWGNHAISCLETFRHAEAEESLQQAIKFETKRSTRTYYNELALLMIQEGRFLEAKDALQKGRAQRDKRNPETWQFDTGMRKGVLATLLYVAGLGSEAERLARHVAERPDRLGWSTTTADKQTFLANLDLLAALRLRQAEAEEDGVLNSHLVADETRTVEMWTLTNKIRKQLHEERLGSVLRPHLEDSVAPWFAGELLATMPTGVATRVLEQTRATEDHAGAASYFDAYSAELAWRKGLAAEAIELAQAALKGLSPEGEKLLRLRVQAIAAMAELQQGRVEECAKYLDPVLDGFPAVLRILNACVPVSIEDDGTDQARQLAKLLAQSPRLRLDPAGLKILIRSDAHKLTCEMFRYTNARHIEIEVDRVAAGDQAPTAGYKAFHDKLIAPALSLDQVTINGIDGSAISVRERSFAAKLLD